MTALVTGFNGFLGASLVERLLARGETDVRCLVRSGSNRRRLEEVIRSAPDPRRAEVFVGSLGSPEAARQALEGVSVVYHLAAGLSGAAADIYLSTVVASKHLLEAIVRSDRRPRVLLVSSFGVYGVADLERGHVVDESTPLEPHPERRDLYSQAKLRQERLFWDSRERAKIPLTVLRPGVIYGPAGAAFSARVGLSFPGIFLHLGRDNVLPLSYVDNCAEAIAVAGRSERADGEVYNVHDDDLPTCREYLALYRRHVRPVRAVSLPYPATLLMSHLVERYHAYSRGQLPAVFTPYKTATTWKGNRFDNKKLKTLGWRQAVTTDEGLRRTFDAHRARLEAAS